MIVGNDVSEYQGKIDWDTYKKNSNFVIIRATIGTARVDNEFFRNSDEARRVGLPLGFYHYSYPQYNTPEAEADYVAKQLADIRDGELICLDFEEQWNNPVDFCKRFLDRLSSLLNGYKPLIYLNQSQTSGFDWKPLVVASYGLWLASYTYDPNKNPGNTGAWKFMAMQQWTNQQLVSGIVGKVDGDCFFGDVTTFKKYGYKKPIPIDPCATQNTKIIELTTENKRLTTELTTTKGLLTTAQGKLQKIIDYIKSLTNG